MTTTTKHDRSAFNPGGLLSSLRYSSALALGLAGTAFAQSAAPTPTPTPSTAAVSSTTDSTVTMEQFTVTGYAESLSKSLDAQRKSNENIQVISAEDAGKFPDTNLAESLSHLPGITIDRLFGQGERVSIQGTDPNLSRVLLNGEPISSADWYILDNQSRQFNYLLLTPDVIGTATVYLMPEPKVLEGSVGGTVDVHTLDPMEQKPLVVTGSLTGSFNDRSRKTEGNENAMISWHNDAKTFGVLAGFEDLRDYVRRDGIEALAQKDNTNLGVGGPVTNQPAGPWVTDEVVNTAIFTQLRHHTGGNADIEFKPNSNLTIDLSGLYVKQTMNNVNFSYYIYPGDNWSGLPNITNATVAGGILSKYTINSAPLVIDAFNRAAEIKTQDYNGKIIYKSDDLSVVTDAGYTRATGGTQHQFFAEYFVFANANINDNASQASFSATGVPGVDANASNLNNGQDFNAAGEPGLDYGNIASNPEVDDEKWVQIDAAVPFKGALTSLDFGARFSDHKDGENGNVVGIPGSYENGPGTANAPANGLGAIGVQNAPSNYLSGLSGVTPSMSQHVLLTNYGSVANFVGNLSASSLNGGKSQTLLQYFDSQPPSDAAVFTATPTFTIDERITAGYFEGEFKDGPLAGNFGARFVQTTTTSASYNLTPAVPVLQTLQNTYDNFLPSVNLTYDLTGDQLIRLGAAEVIARPNTAAEANYVQLYDASLTGVGGNADLNPYKSTNYDLAYDFYPAKNSVFQVDLFYKDITNYIVNAAVAEQHADAQLGGTQTYEITRPTNGGAATSEGASISFQQTYSNGLGFSVNYTRMHTTSSNGVLPYSSKNQFNVSPFFENKFGLLRFTYSWRDDYLSSTFNGTSAINTAPFAELDANGEVYLTKNISLIFTATNLLDETYKQYYEGVGVPKLFTDAYKFGRGYTAGIHLKF